MVPQDSGSLYLHEKCRCRLKKMLDGHLSKATKRGDVYSPWTSANTPPRPRGHTCGCADAPPWRKLHTFEDQNPQQGWCPPVHFRSSAKEKETSLLFANKDYKGSPARSRRKVQTHCHLRDNFSSLGEERAPMKSTESLADITTRLLGIARSSPQTARVRRDALLASFLLASPPPKTLQGASWRTSPSAPPPRE